MRLLLAVVCLFTGGCVVGVVGAAGSVAQFGEPGEGADQFSEPRGIAVDNSGEPLVDSSAGDVYIADRNNNRVEKFGPEGEFLLAWGWGVVDGKSELQICGPAASPSSETCEPGIEGAGPGQFSFPQGIAVDSDPLSASRGDVYVEDPGNNRVEKFTPNGEFLLMFGAEVNKNGTNVCKAGEECQAGTTGAGAGQFEPLSPNTIAVDSSGTVYVGDKERAQEFSAAGVFERRIALPGLGQIEALAVDSAEPADVYVTSSEGGVHEFEGCAVSCVGKELGEARDPSATGFNSAIAVGPSGDLFVGESGRVAEFEPGGGEVESFASAEPTVGLAFGDSIGRLYLLTPEKVQLLAPQPPGPLVESEEAVPGPAGTATVRAVIDPEGLETKYHLDYGLEVGSETATEPVAMATEGFEPEVVEVKLSGLTPSTVYHFHFVAENSAGTAAPADQTFTTLPPVSIVSESVSQVSATSARLAVEINPLGSATEYHFEYGRTTAYEKPRVPVPDANAGSGIEPVSLTAIVDDLTPETTYHYRVVARNQLGEVKGPDQTFTTQGTAVSSGLIDGRAWELVSPPAKHGSSLEMSTREGGLVQAAEDGSGLAYIAVAPIDTQPAGSRSFAYTQLVSKRTAPGVWNTQDITTPEEAVTKLIELSEYKLFSPDLSQALVEPTGATPLSPRTTERTPYLREVASEVGNEEYVPLLPAANMPPGTKFGGTEQTPQGSGFEGGVTFVTSTPDLSHVVLRSRVGLTGGFESPNVESLYELSGGALQLVSILPDGKSAAEEGLTARVGSGNEGVRNAVSTDGARVVFETEFNGSDHNLYVRDLSVGETVQLDAVQSGVNHPGTGKPVFVDASDDGSKLFFVDGQRLTTDSTAQGAGEPDLYMCEVTIVADELKCTLKDLTVPLGAHEHADVLGADIGTDTTGRYVYFVANGVLAPGAVHGTCGASEPASLAPLSSTCNLYMHDTVSGETRLVAVLAGRDAPDWQASFEERNNLGEMTARVSRNGRYLAFMSQRSLTGYDNRDANSGVPDEEVFLYDRDGGSLRCVSCNPTGARPTGVFDGLSTEPPFPVPLLVDRPDVWANQWLAGSIPGWTRVDLLHALYQPRYLSDEGRLFFDSADALVPEDANGKEDVYEFEPDGVGSCGLASGCIGLISSGTSNEESAFLDASGPGPGGQEGEDVFFMTAAQLTSQDVDGALDVYDAHVCQAAAPCPSGSVTVPPPCSTADSCRAASPPQPEIFGPPPSATFAGAGNLAPQPPRPAPALTRAQKLAKALRSCRAKRNHKKRSKCEATARKRYGPAKRKPRKAKSKRRGKR